MTAKAAATSAKHKTTTAKHTATKKHTETAKQKAARSAAAKKAAATRKKDKVTTKAKTATHATASKAVGYAVGDLLPACAFEAAAQSLRLAGQFVHDDEVAWLWELAGSPPLGASVPAALNTARLHGLAGFRPRFQRLVTGVGTADQLALPFAEHESVAAGPFEDLFAGDLHGLILAVDRPGPHAVLATDRGWWSWGELYSPWGAAVDEAWAVSWS